MGTNASLSLWPVQLVCCLCCLQQERLHVGAWQPGHLYLGEDALHTLQRDAAAPLVPSTAGGDTISVLSRDVFMLVTNDTGISRTSLHSPREIQ
jgi:hypothetical protein